MTQHDRMVWHWRATCCVWFVCMTIGTHVPQEPPTEQPIFVSPDKLLHFVCFGVLTFLFMCSQWVRNVGIIFLILLAWALLDETSQDLLPLQREFSGEDLLAGVLGIFATLCWYGALRLPQLRTLKEAIECTLAQTSNWCKIAGVGILVFCVTALCIWFGALELYGVQESKFALFTATVLGTVMALLLLYRLANVRCDFLKHKKSAVAVLLGTMCMAVVLLLQTQYNSIDPWVLAMFVFVIGSRIAWAKAL